jgi:uncharacterized UPF0146 family protein
LETCRRIEGLVDFIADRYRKPVEIGIGHFPDVAFALRMRGISVFATDIRPFCYQGIPVFFDDITSPDLSLYEGTELLYSLRPPPELIPYMKGLAKKISADLIIKPLSSEHPQDLDIILQGDTTFFMCNQKNHIGTRSFYYEKTRI